MFHGIQITRYPYSLIRSLIGVTDDFMIVSIILMINSLSARGVKEIQTCIS